MNSNHETAEELQVWRPAKRAKVRDMSIVQCAKERDTQYLAFLGESDASIAMARGSKNAEHVEVQDGPSFEVR
jgi:hypothetical protein